MLCYLNKIQTYFSWCHRICPLEDNNNNNNDNDNNNNNNDDNNNNNKNNTNLTDERINTLLSSYRGFEDIILHFLPFI